MHAGFDLSQRQDVARKWISRQRIITETPKLYLAAAENHFANTE